MTARRHGATTPPSEIKNDANSLLAAMREGVQHTFVIQIRGLSIPCRVLSLDEMNRVRRQSIIDASIYKGDDVDRDVEMQKNTLRLATAMDGNPSFLNDRFFAQATTEEINFIYSEWIKCVDSVNPDLETMPADEFKRLVADIKKNNVSARDCSLRQLRVIFTAYQDLIQRPAPPESPAVS